ncbi:MULTISPECIES: ZapG family protein [unclassified Gilliamella]|uniref:ZapG family protein n=1 Tax=unclassified Gilliamella TaxID=2685620 RepID=UPI00080DB696|nr:MULTISPECIES: DUF1043 family protein [Gilliamella]MCX8575226.1 DUF1043 family protein [Gilliamella sp. B3831]MCX8577609.1 DUF1043 family protein [Gilliamella sp. B3815]MCX8579284.1 DUF1043 family protein [Gilliamella sp. B2717]MCX8588676.1 DUF1043 family protein [Gilliamella sp. B3801]MCX8590289.1 DUF1043 family protein [Gilliamella sp. B3812]
MEKDIIIYILIGLVIGLIVGAILMNVVSPKARQYANTKRELDKAQEELKTQKQMIAQHFSHSAEILDNMAKEFRRLYQHMAENSQQIIGSENMPNLSLDENNSDSSPKLVLEKQPKDYSDNPSNLFKTDDQRS